MRSALAALVTFGIVVTLAAASTADTPATKTDRRGPITVAVTPTPAEGAVRVKVVLDTHSVGLDGIALDKSVVLVGADDKDVVATSLEEATGSGHHRSAVLVFPQPASTSLRIVVRGIGGVAERTFTWEPWPAR